MKKKNVLSKILSFIVIIFIFLLLGLILYFQNKPLININEDILRVYFFDIGQGDCTLAINNGKTMLIDGGNEADSQNLIDYMKRLGITKLDYVVATHYDIDHITGLDKIILAFDVGTIYMPTTSETNKEIQELYNATNGKKIIHPIVGEYFYLGNSKCTILNCGDNTKVSENNSSIVIQLDYRETNCLFMGDAEKEVEDNIKWSDIDILKVSHHGSNTSTTQKFIEETKPEYSIISVGANNKYNLPSIDVLTRLKESNSIVYRTDSNGTIILSSDGTNYSFSFDETSLDGNN